MTSETQPVTRFERPSDALQHLQSITELARRSIDIFSQQLAGSLYENSEFVTNVSKLARRSAVSQVRILVRDCTALHGQNHAMVNLARRLPTHILIKAYTEGAADPNMAFVCVDQAHLVYFANEATATGFTRQDARAESRRILEEFDQLWRYNSKDDPNLRLLSL